MRVVALLFAVAVVCLYEMPDLIRNRLWKETAVFLFLTALASTLVLLMLVGVAIPNPIAWMDATAEWILAHFQ